MNNWLSHLFEKYLLPIFYVRMIIDFMKVFHAQTIRTNAINMYSYSFSSCILYSTYLVFSTLFISIFFRVLLHYTKIIIRAPKGMRTPTPAYLSYNFSSKKQERIFFKSLKIGWSCLFIPWKKMHLKNVSALRVLKNQSWTVLFTILQERCIHPW